MADETPWTSETVILGSDSKVGGPGGTPLTSSVVLDSAASPKGIDSSGVTASQMLLYDAGSGKFKPTPATLYSANGSSNKFSVNTTVGSDALVGLVFDKGGTTHVSMGIQKKINGVEHYNEGFDVDLPEIILVYDNLLPQTTTTLSSGLSTGSPITAIPVAALPQAIPAGGNVYITDGATNAQLFACPAGAAQGATSIPVTSQTPNFAYTNGTTVKGVVSGDCLRWAHGAHLWFGPGIGSPDTSRRLDISSNSQEDPATRILVHVGTVTGSPVTTFLQCDKDSTQLFKVDTNGNMSVGSGSLGVSAGLDVTGDVLAHRADSTPSVSLQRTGSSTQMWSMSVLSGNGNKWALNDATSGTYPIQIGVGTPSGMILTSSGGLGFWGIGPVAKQSLTGALSSVTDANAKAVLTALVNALTNYGLTTNSTT